MACKKLAAAIPIVSTKILVKLGVTGKTESSHHLHHQVSK